MRKIAGVLVAVLLFPATASAWTASRGPDGSVSVTAEPGETNTLTVDLTANPPVAQDTTATYHETTPACPACLADAAGVTIYTGDRDDTITFKGRSRQTDRPDQIDPGPGRDTVLATGSGPTTVLTRDGEVDTITCSTPKTVVFADDDDVAHGCRIVVRPHPRPATAVVTTTADEDGEVCDASCSLREAVNAVLLAGAGVVVVPSGTYYLATPISVPNGISILGANARSTILRSAGGASVLEFGRPDYSEIRYSAGSNLSGVTVECVGACASAPLTVTAAGGVSADTIRILDRQVDTAPAIAGGLNVRNSTILVKGGGGIKAPGSVSVENTTISGTSPDGAPGVETAGPATLAHVTLEGGLRNGRLLGPVFVDGSILAGPCEATVASLGTNVLDPSCGPRGSDTTIPAELGPLADNGGPTETRLPAPGSSAIDRAGPCDGTDQRGFARPIGGACDAGAVEAGTLPPPTPQPADRTRPSITALKASAHRGRIAALRKLTLRFKLSEPARVRASFRGHAVTADLRAGTHRVRVGTLLRRTLKPGRYTLTLTATDPAGNRSSTRRTVIRVIR